MAVIRSCEVSLNIFYQQLAQCKAIYDKNAETILDNMDSVVFLGGRKSSVIKEIFENWLGKATISMQTAGPVGKLQPEQPAVGPEADDPQRACHYAR